MTNVNDIYLPYDERTPDSQYQDLARKILREGILTPTRPGVEAWTLLAEKMEFDLSNGFPIGNDRDLSKTWQRAIDELGAFINGAHTRDEFRAYGIESWWDAWLQADYLAALGMPPDDTGPGSYGPALRYHPDPEGGTFDQMQALVDSIRKSPTSRRHKISTWIPPLAMSTPNRSEKAALPPCHGDVQVTILGNGLYLEMDQRSGDLGPGVPHNTIQYAALTLFLAHLTGFRPARFIHVVRNVHIYNVQEEKMRMLVDATREPRRLPTLKLNEKGLAATDIHQFRGDLFELSDYHPHPGVGRIPAPV